MSLAGGAVGGSLAGLVGWQLAGDDSAQVGDWRIGGARFIGFLVTLGVAIGSLLARRVVSGKRHVADGYVFSYRRIAPRAGGDREGSTVTVAELVAELTRDGYEPIVTACDDAGEPVGPIALDVPLAGANLGIRDPQVKGWVRLQLAPESEVGTRRIGVLETWTHRGESTAELALFTLRALDRLAADLTVAHRSSQLGQDPAALVTAALAATPIHRDGLARLGANR